MTTAARRRRTRLAPSPTGALHLGNARTFLINWLLARQSGWDIVLRIDDLDGPRIKRGSAAAAMEDLRWLGLDWDGQPTFQSAATASYAATIEQLLKAGQAYPCICSRREVDTAASAPHAEDGAAVYAGTCRGKFATPADARRSAGANRPVAIRFAVPHREIVVHDAFAGRVVIADVAAALGDFVIGKAEPHGDITAAYQLAVVVDDHAAGVTEVVRGDDLLDSVPRQQLIYESLGWSDAIPNYTHLPLVVGPDGRRLAKRHGDSRLASYRHAGVPAATILQLLARWCAIDVACNRPITSARDLLGQFHLQSILNQPVIFDEEAERELQPA